MDEGYCYESDAFDAKEERLDNVKTLAKPMVAPCCKPTSSNYYDAGGIETITVIKAKLTPEQFKGWLLGNIIKYSTRLNHKGFPKEDATKLADYTVMLAELYNKGYDPT